MSACPHCAELRLEVEYLRALVGMEPDRLAVEVLRRAFDVRPGVARLLLTMHRAKDRVLPIHYLNEAVRRSREGDNEGKLADAYITYARKALGTTAIETVYGTGRRLSPDGWNRVDAVLSALQPRARAA